MCRRSCRIEYWYSTQSVSFALVAVAQNAGAKPFKGFSFDYSLHRRRQGADHRARVNRRWPASCCPRRRMAGMPLELTNTSDRKLYVTASVRAVPRSGEEQPSTNGLTLTVNYSDADGNAVDIAKVPQGMDLIAQVVGEERRHARAWTTWRCRSSFPGGWEIRNDRLEDVDTAGEREQDKAYRGSYWWVPGEWRSAADAPGRVRRHPRRPRAALLQPALG